MVLNLGGFKFEWKQTSEIAVETEFGINSAERINNHSALLNANLGTQSITLSGQTLPFACDGQSALKPLYALAELRKSLPLVTGLGKYLGRFAIEKISENRSVFAPNGAFFTQTFSLTLRRDYDADEFNQKEKR
ncbi:phage tail protein [uncultured Campylobacter sp.]|uniref:phage tail protein n=1 Tax=uncultured Campylobacter sp. TaxID=218934 RepID=UPI002610EBBB|nr:phage tail protein [uncultured Campylobacter sp.]